MKSILGLSALTTLFLIGCGAQNSGHASPSLNMDDPRTCNNSRPEKAPLTFRDVNGVQWTRHILTETRADGRTLLLVTDQPEGHGHLNQVIIRKSFARKDLAELLQALHAVAAPLTSSNLAPMTPQRPLTITNNPIWPIDHGWTEQDEIDYGSWLGQVGAADMLSGGGVDVDCADYGITLRWIYAHDHHLPAGDQLAATGDLFGSWQSTTEWDQLATDNDWKKDARFKAALRYVLDHTFTHTLFTDLYPVAITPDFVTNGTIFLTITGNSGHTRTIISVGQSTRCNDMSECISILWGNEPASEMGFITDFVPNKVDSTEGGFMRFRWPEKTASGWQLRAAQNMRGYSTEQYTFTDDAYLETISTRLSIWTSSEDRYKLVGHGTIDLLHDRIGVTEQGYFICSLVPCKTSDPEYTDWSTPVRDHAIVASVKNFQIAATKVDPNGITATQFQQETSRPLFAGFSFSGFDVLSGDLSSKYVSDPTIDFFARWGVAQPSVADQLYTWSDIIINMWNLREMQVFNAQVLCFPNDSTKAVCDPCDPKVKKLNTRRIDQAFRQIQPMFIAAFNATTPDVRQEITGLLTSNSTAENYCSADGTGYCTFIDYIFGTPNHWTAMTSEPDAPIRSRFGF